MAEKTSTATPLRAGPQVPGSRRWAALALLCVVQLMLILDVTVVNVALPDIGSGLGVGRGTLTWVLTAYTMVFGGLMLLGGRLADRYGARRVLVSGLVIFVAASLVSGTAVDGAMLIGGRAAQGIGAALLSPSALSLVTTMFTGAERNKALGAWAAVGGSGAALGVIAGGVLTSAAGWAWVFFINAPIGLVVLLAVPVVIPAGAASPGQRRIDGPGAVTVTAATGAAIYGLVNAGTSGWGSVSALAPIGMAAVLYGTFGVRERRTAHPLIDPRVLRQRAMAVGAFLMLIATGLLVGAFFLGSFYLQRARGFSALATGLAFLPVAVAAVAGAHTGGRLAASRDRRALSASALALTALGAAVAAAWHSPVVLIAGMSIAALGTGATLVTATTTALADVPPGEAGVRSALVSTFHEFGSALGVAVLSSLAASSVAAAGPGAGSLTGFTRAFAAIAIAAIAAAVIAALLAPPGKAVPGAGPMVH
jgi:EmrB/QacA subfamily drug resistance transporter